MAQTIQLGAPGGPLQVVAFNPNATTVAPVIGMLDQNNNLSLPGGISLNQGVPGGPAVVGLNGGLSFVPLTGFRNIAGAILPTTTTTNSFLAKNTVGSINAIQLNSSSNANNTAAMVHVNSIPSGYPNNGSNLNINVACQLNLTAGATASVKTINTAFYVVNEPSGTYGASLTNGTAQTVLVTPGTLSWAVTGTTSGTANFTGTNSFAMEVMGNCTETAGTAAQVQINGIWFS